MLGGLVIYLIATGLGLWSGTKWGVILCVPWLISFIGIGLAILVRILMGSLPLNGDSLALVFICVIGGLGWATEVGNLWQQVNRRV